MAGRSRQHQVMHHAALAPELSVRPLSQQLIANKDISLFKRVVRERLRDDINRGSSGISAFPECPRSPYVDGFDDWMTFPQCQSLDICPSCFASVIGPTEYGRIAVPNPHPNDVTIIYDFGGGPWYRLAWLMMAKARRTDLQPLRDLSTISAKFQSCFGKVKKFESGTRSAILRLRR